MLQLIQTLGLPFLVCIIMGSTLGYLGIHVLKREVIFVDIAFAQRFSLVQPSLPLKLVAYYAPHEALAMVLVLRPETEHQV